MQIINTKEDYNRPNGKAKIEDVTDDLDTVESSTTLPSISVL